MKILFTFIFGINLLFSASFVYPNFKQCYKKDVKSIVYFGDTKAIAISKHYAVAYLKKRPRYPFVKHDPFLDLYLFYSQKPLHPVRLKDTDKLSLGEWLASIDENSLYVGNFAKRGQGLDIFFKQNSKTPPNSMITCLCCDVYGVGMGDGKFISSNFIKRFLHSTDIFYGDIGVRFDKRGKSVIVLSANPLFPHQLLKRGDIIKKINGKKINSIEDAQNIILFQKRNSVIKVEFLRNEKLRTAKIKVQKRFGGGELSDTFLETKGLFFDKNLKILVISKGSFGEKLGLKIGDKLLEVDGKSVKNENEIKYIFSKLKNKEISLLFDRDNFQFFVKVPL